MASHRNSYRNNVNSCNNYSYSSYNEVEEADMISLGGYIMGVMAVSLGLVVMGLGLITATMLYRSWRHGHSL